MKTVLVVVAHPDDETFGTGSVIAKVAADGARVIVCCATRGEAGEDASGTTRTAQELGAVREQELRAAARALGAVDVVLLDFADSGMTGAMPEHALSRVDVAEVADAVAEVITRVAPDVVVTLDCQGVNDHRDHQRIGDATTLAFQKVALPGACLYYWTLAAPVMREWLAEMKANGLFDKYVDLELGRPEADITTILDVSRVMDARRAAIAEHHTQASVFTGMSAQLEQRILSRDFLIRVVPPWDGGEPETELLGAR
jgi:LmbE family N-acetylglucosaminyl deacetylase